MTMTISGTSGLTFNDASTQNTAATGFGFKNRLINGAMVIDQRNAGASITPSAGGTYSVDRWRADFSQASKFSMQQNGGAVTPPAGFANYLGITSLAATSVGASDYFLFSQAIEGFNVADLAWGSVSAAPITVSFWVRSSLTGTFGGALKNSAGNRSYPFSYTIGAANTWEQKTITIAGDTSGTWLTTSSTGIQVQISLGAGSTFSGTAGAWASANLISATGAVSVVGTSGATFYITGVQLEKGSTATSFDYRPYGTELALCQRYFWKTFPQSRAPSNGGGQTLDASTSTLSVVGGTPSYFSSIFYTVPMRAIPTTTIYNPISNTPNTVVAFTLAGPSANVAALVGAGFDSHVDLYINVGTAYYLAYYALTASAEL